MLKGSGNWRSALQIGVWLQGNILVYRYWIEPTAIVSCQHFMWLCLLKDVKWKSFQIDLDCKVKTRNVEADICRWTCDWVTLSSKNIDGMLYICEWSGDVAGLCFFCNHIRALMKEGICELGVFANGISCWRLWAYKFYRELFDYGLSDKCLVEVLSQWDSFELNLCFQFMFLVLTCPLSSVVCFLKGCASQLLSDKSIPNVPKIWYYFVVVFL